MQIIKDIVPKKTQDELENYFLGNNFPLYLNRETVNIDDRTGFSDFFTKDGIVFNHYFIREGQLVSNDWTKIQPIAVEFVNKLNLPPKISSCKLNISFPNPLFNPNNYFPPHYDTPDKGIIAIYYVNDSDGDTLLFKNERMDGVFPINDQFTPQKGSMIYFEHSILHANRPPINSPLRCVINFNFLFEGL